MKISVLDRGRALLLVLALLSGLPTARAQQVATLQSLYSFGSGGSYPVAGLVPGSDGSLYGVTSNGGDDAGDGTVFRVSGAGVVTTLHAFSGSDGSQPFAGLALGSDGSLYGTTSTGGANGAGAIFKLTAAGAFTPLHSFTGADGSQPQADLLSGGDGSFYGTTTYGGANGSGTVFKMTTAGAVTTLYSFGGGTDGSYPAAGLLRGADGSFYGTTSDGGNANGDGTIFRITATGTLTTLHAFSGTDGYQPVGRLVPGSDGNFYGTTNNGGASGYGTVFRITPAGALTTLHSFSGGNDGAYPYAGLLRGADGNFYGTASAGGSASGDGTIFQITPAGTLTTLSLFSGSDGAQPQTALVAGSDGSLYGTTSGGGAGGTGTIFRVTLATAAPFFAGEAPVGNDAYYLAFSTGNFFGYYAFLSDPRYVFHFDLGWEFVFDAADGHQGVYLYDFKSGGFFYTSPEFPFPYLYDFSLDSVVYYYPEAAQPGHYTTNPRYFFVFAGSRIITK